MPKFSVTLIGRADMFTEVEVEAENAEQAEAMAQTKASTRASDWQFEDSPVHTVEAIETLELVEEEDLPSNKMKVLVNGKEEVREVDYVQTDGYPSKPTAVPVLHEGELIGQTLLDGKIFIVGGAGNGSL